MLAYLKKSSMSSSDHCRRRTRTKERLAVEIPAITIAAKGQIKLSLTLRLIVQMGKGRLRVVNMLGETNQFVRFATVVTAVSDGVRTAN